MMTLTDLIGAFRTWDFSQGGPWNSQERAVACMKQAADELERLLAEVNRDDAYLCVTLSEENDRLIESNREKAVEIERLRAIFVEAHNFWRHDFRDEVEVAADRLFKKLSVNNTDPFADRRGVTHARDALCSHLGGGDHG